MLVGIDTVAQGKLHMTRGLAIAAQGAMRNHLDPRALGGDEERRADRVRAVLSVPDGSALLLHRVGGYLRHAASEVTKNTAVGLCDPSRHGRISLPAVQSASQLDLLPSAEPEDPRDHDRLQHPRDREPKPDAGGAHPKG